jgi:hypothetical protein
MSVGLDVAKGRGGPSMGEEMSLTMVLMSCKAFVSLLP